MGVVSVWYWCLVVRAPPREMKTRILILFVCLAAHPSFAQGVFAGSNLSGRTRVGSLDGSLAGTNIFGQFLAGPTADSLTPVGITRSHFAGGVFAPGNITVPNVPAFSYAFVQLVAWDSLLWGTAFVSVPGNQFGRTDIVSVYLTREFDVLHLPVFMQPAIVPIPEPTTWALLALGGTALWCAHRRRK